MNQQPLGGAESPALLKRLVEELTAINRKVTYLSVDEISPSVYAGELSPL